MGILEKCVTICATYHMHINRDLQLDYITIDTFIDDVVGITTNIGNILHLSFREQFLHVFLIVLTRIFYFLKFKRFLTLLCIELYLCKKKALLVSYI